MPKYKVRLRVDLEVEAVSETHAIDMVRAGGYIKPDQIQIEYIYETDDTQELSE